MKTTASHLSILLTFAAAVVCAMGQDTPASLPAANLPADEAAITVNTVEPVPEQPMDADQAVPVKAPVKKMDETLSVDFPDESIRNILRNVADLYELNVVIPDTLVGNASVKLRDVSWRQIYQVVLAPVEYTFVEEGNIIKVVSNESIQKEPVGTEVFIINYARAADLQPAVASLVDPAAGGKIMVDLRSNALVITERPSRMNRIRPLIEQLDHATEQVMIETKFIEVTDSDIKNIGVNWASLSGWGLGIKSGGENDEFGGVIRNRGQDQRDGSTGSSSTSGSSNNSSLSGQNTGSSTSSSVTSTNGVITTTSTTGTTGSINNSATAQVLNDTASTGSLLQSLTNTASTDRVLSAVFTADQFKLVLSALQTAQSSKIVSNPTVVTLNNTEAVINVGTERPIPNYTYNQERGVFEVAGFTYKPIGIILKVTPQVNSRGFIKLVVEPEVSQSTRDSIFQGAAIPIIDTRKAKTQITLKDGFTMGIGGLISSTAGDTSSKVPVLGSIPLLGRLFRSNGKNIQTTNLLIFITARTVSPDGAKIEEVFDSRQIRRLELQRDELPGYRDGSDPFAPLVPPTVPESARGQSTSASATPGSV